MLIYAIQYRLARGLQLKGKVLLSFGNKKLTKNTFFRLFSKFYLSDSHTAEHTKYLFVFKQNRILTKNNH